MNLEIFKRNIKLQELGIDKLSGIERIIFDFLNENLTDLNVYTSDRHTYLNRLFFGKDTENIVLTYNKKSGHLNIDYDIIWKVFKYTFNMDNFVIDELITWWVGTHKNLKVNSISNLSFKNYYKGWGILS